MFNGVCMCGFSTVVQSSIVFIPNLMLLLHSPKSENLAIGRFSSHVTETHTWVTHVKWMKGIHVAMLCLVTRNKQKHEAKGPSLVKDEATRA